ncbi:unnamed protein product [Phytophthora lilii]|uniref:Unnamed protein product n=1 Tax=Phytophthora lilii TaxID=2077276 RepID=A0A9W6X2V0_9STRA|nr:unnamed protein product [Phytophthora lilii]
MDDEVLTLLDAIDSPESDSSSGASLVDSEADATSDTSPKSQPQLKITKAKRDRRRKEGPVSDANLSDLSSNLGKLRLEADRVLPAIEDNVTITCTSRNTYHEAFGNRIETSSITLMACSVQQAGEILWHHITTKKNKDREKAFRFVRTRNPYSFERNCLASLRDGNGAVLNLDGVNVLRKYKEAHRIILVGTTTWFLPTGGLQFEDHHWTVISSSPTAPLDASVVRSCYQLQVKHVDTASVVPIDFTHTNEVVLKSIGKKLRNVLQLQQDTRYSTMLALWLTETSLLKIPLQLQFSPVPSDASEAVCDWDLSSVKSFSVDNDEECGGAPVSREPATRKKEKAIVPYSTSRQRRIRAEVLALRHMRELEDCLCKMQHQRQAKVRSQSSGVEKQLNCFEQAAIQRQK